MPLLQTRPVVELRLLLEVMVCVVATWLLLGWRFEPITQADGNWLVAPYVDSVLHAGSWADHLYRFGVIGGSKMHEFGGTPPLLDLCGALGLSTTATLNVQTMFVQVGFGFFGVLAIEACLAKWERPMRLDGPQRIVAIWICAFAPVLGWRIGLGHENLIVGLLPWVAAVTLVWCSSPPNTPPSPVALAFAAFAVWNGITGLGSQSVIYSAVFGAPLLVVSLIDARPALRELAPAACALAGGVLLALPRLAGMIAHAAGDDASRAIGERVVYSEGTFAWSDLIGSLSWVAKLATEDGTIHERHYPIGPLLLLFAVAPRRFTKLAWGLAGGLVLAVLFATDTSPISTALLSIPMLESFRVPARALLPVISILPMLALAAWWAGRARLAPAEDIPRTWPWLAILVAIGAILGLRSIGPAPREVLAWLVCLGLVAALRFAPARFAQARLSLALPVVAAFAVMAFADRLPRGLAIDPIEHGPTRLRTAVLEKAPELRMPLNRIEIIDGPAPYTVSSAFAARLPSLDGVWYPPRRFLTLLGAIDREPLAPTTCVFGLGRSRSFPILQQLYNVRYVMQFLPDGPPTVLAMPPSPGPAWFVSRLERMANADRIADAWRGLADPVAGLGATGWTLGDEAKELATSPDCTRARVIEVTTDEVGQRATFVVDTPAACTLVVATNYVSTFVATVGDRQLPVAPIDIALTGIAVPAGTTRVLLEPVVDVPAWARLAMLLGIAALAAAIYLASRRAKATVQ